ncbi:hypothetical protein Trydic_g19009 [Trypoxylus dichotomus]
MKSNSDLLNSSVTRQNINNISDAAGIARHGPSVSILQFMCITVEVVVPYRIVSFETYQPSCANIIHGLRRAKKTVDAEPGCKKEPVRLQDRFIPQIGLSNQFFSTRLIVDRLVGSEGRPNRLSQTHCYKLTISHYHLGFNADSNVWSGVGMHGDRVRTKRRRWEHRDIQFSIKWGMYRAVGAFVWGAVAYESRPQLVFIRGTMNTQHYVDEVMEYHLLPYLQ